MSSISTSVIRLVVVTMCICVTGTILFFSSGCPMALQSMSRTVLSRAPILPLILSHLLPETFKNELENTLIINPIEYEHIVSQCFSVFRTPFIPRQSGMHHICLCFCNYIASWICFEKVVDGLTVWRYRVLHLALMRLWFLWDAGVERSGGGASWRAVAA